MDALVIGKKGIEKVNSFSLLTSFNEPESLFMRAAVSTKAGKTPIKTKEYSLEIKPYAFPNAESLYDNDIVLAYHEGHKLVGTVSFIRNGLYYGITCVSSGNIYPLYKCSLVQRLGNTLDSSADEFLFLLEESITEEKKIPVVNKGKKDAASSKDYPLVIYTTGACSKNPGPCAWAYIITKNDEILKEDAGFLSNNGTNNIAELISVITALRQLKKKQPIIVKNSSTYIVDAFKKGWIRKWANNGYMKKDNTPILNQELWKELISLTMDKDISFEWIPGNSDDPLNERSVFLSNEALNNEFA